MGGKKGIWRRKFNVRIKIKVKERGKGNEGSISI